jgi:capsular polysaccharide export protein
LPVRQDRSAVSDPVKDADAARMPGGMRPLHVFSAGFLTQTGLRAFLRAAGWQVRFGLPPVSRHQAVGVWGRKPVSVRGRLIAQALGRELVTIEDGFLRSVYPGDRTVPPLSLMIDPVGVYYDAAKPSFLEVALQNGVSECDDSARAQAGIAMLRELKLSKYTPPQPAKSPEPGYILVIDQTAGDASIPGAFGDATSFARMLDAARAENPAQRIIIKTHPDVIAGRKRGHFDASNASANVELLTAEVNPWDLIEGAGVVYTVSSQMGYEAVLAGKPVRCFGAGFYSGWGLTQDEITVPRRTALHTRETLFATCHLACPIYFDPWRSTLSSFEGAIEALQTLLMHERRTGSETGEVFGSVRLWKRRNIARFRPRLKRRPKFTNEAEHARGIAKHEQRRLWIWASHATLQDAPDTGYVEDGFLRSVGLGAELTQAASLVFDSTGIYYDPTRGSDLEDLIADAAEGDADTPRARNLIDSIVKGRLSKYNVGRSSTQPKRIDTQTVLVPGQVEDDASIQRGTGEVRTNLALLQAARDGNPAAHIIYKPHPDVEAGLRTGLVPVDQLALLADEVARDLSPIDLIERADAIWTMTSLMGFEALIRDKQVTCLGMPFYAGWGLTTDLGPICPRRIARPTLEQLTWAALIAYPRYVDPISGLPCTPELIVERLSNGHAFPMATALSRLQSLFASQSWLWR